MKPRISFTALILVALTLVVWRLQSEIQRQVKIKTLFGGRTPAGIERTTKAYPGSLTLFLQSSTTPPINSTEPFTLVATIGSDESIPDLEFRWIIPPEVRVLSGDPNPTVSVIGGRSSSVSIVLSVSDTDRNFQVLATVGHTHGGGRHGNVAQFNTNPNRLDIKHRMIFAPHIISPQPSPSKTKIIQ